MKKILFRAAAAGIIVLIAAILARAVIYESKQLEVEPAPQIAVDTLAVAERLAGALRIETISHQDSAEFDADAFQRFHTYLAESFPTVHAVLSREVVSGSSLLYRWEGSAPELQPLLFMAHMDVVPVEPGTESEWTHPPFAGRIADGYVWGRGALDDKGTLVTQLEAIELLLNRDFQPRRTVYLAFGHDEEVGGTLGAARIAEELKQQAIQFEYVLDEGGIITDAIEIEPLAFRSEPSPMSDLGSPSFQALQRTVHQIFPEAIFAPYLVVGGTDSRYYTDVTANVYRFNPMYLDQDDFKSLHGTDERVSLEACADMVRFYVQLMGETAG